MILENTDAKIIVGVDDSGTGALAGPLIVCAAAFLREDFPVAVTYKGLHQDSIITVGDSKNIKQVHREMLDQVIRSSAHALAVIERSNTEIDEQLMHQIMPQTIRLAIARCIEMIVEKRNFTNPKDFLVVIDGDQEIPAGLPCPVRAFADADKTVWQVSAASIVAKVACDARMLELHEKYPRYNFAKHKGYATAEHKRLLKQHGPCAAHRKTYKPVYQAMGPMDGMEF